MVHSLVEDLIDFISQTMNGQYLCNRQITVSYAYKKDTKGERHGTPAGECCLRLLKILLGPNNLSALDSILSF